MARKNLKSVAAALTPAAEKLPTQNVQSVRQATPETPAPTEPLVQFSFGLRKSQRKELQRLASDEDMTMRAFILSALREKGMTVSYEDLKDMRQKQ